MPVSAKRLMVKLPPGISLRKCNPPSSFYLPQSFVPSDVATAITAQESSSNSPLAISLNNRDPQRHTKKSLADRPSSTPSSVTGDVACTSTGLGSSSKEPPATNVKKSNPQRKIKKCLTGQLAPSSECDELVHTSTEAAFESTEHVMSSDGINLLSGGSGLEHGEKPNELERIMQKLNDMDKKLELVTKHCIRQKRLLAEVGSSVSTANGMLNLLTTEKSHSRKIIVPIANDEALMELEILSKEEAGANALRKQFITGVDQKPYLFFRECIRQIFSNTSRYTWTGRSAHNSLHLVPPKNASNLNICQILLDMAQLKHKMTKEALELEMNRAFSNFNETKSATKKRHARRELELSNSVNDLP